MQTKSIEDLYELTPAQQGIFFHALYAPGSGVYIVQVTYLLRGHLDVATFEWAWKEVVARHQVLRTSFHWENLGELTKPLQLVHRFAELPLQRQDWRGISPDAQGARLETFIQTEQAQDFDLAQAPLMRLALLQLADDLHYFVWSTHHLILDGWSAALVLKEVLVLYDAVRHGRRPQLASCPPFHNYIRWLQQQSLAQAEAFWRRHLQGVTTPTRLSLDRSPGSVLPSPQSFSQQSIELSDRSTQALRALAQEHQFTMNTLVQGAWALLLRRYSGEQDVVFGTIVSGRPPTLPDVESMVGMCVNTLPLRVRVPGDTSLLPWLQALQDQQVELQQYEYTPLAQIQEWSAVPRGLPLFESLVAFENYPLEDDLRKGEMDMQIHYVRASERPSYPLTLVGELESKLSLHIIYDCSRYETAIIHSMMGNLQTLLEAMANCPHRQLSTLPLLTREEQQLLLTDWNATQMPYPREMCIHHLFEEQVQGRPDAIAIVLGEQQLTYQELHARANQLAHYLQQLGVKPEVCVGICVQRSLEMVIGLLAILKAGGAYVPLDPRYPQQRLAFLMKNSQVSVLLTQQRLLSTMPAGQIPVICLDTQSFIDTWRDTNPPLSQITSRNLAYVMYTSGSTGTPKGVCVTHQNVVRLVKGTNYVELSEQEVLLQFAPLSFDASTFEIWGALLNGARLVLFAAHMPSLEELGQALGCYQVTTLWLTAGLFHQMVDHQLDKLIPLRQLLAGGDVLSVNHVQKALQAGCHIINGYGPTESTTFTCCYHVTGQRDLLHSVPIGHPISNTQVYLLDSHLQLVPIGVAGQLYIGGDGLARGYLQRPDLTADRFIPHPFSNAPGTLLYQSGDIARYLSDGTIEFLGRVDDQVKLRGFRIEPGEIEMVLHQHPAVRQAVVIAREDGAEGKCLVAYIVVVPQMHPSLNELRGYLEKRLPDYMVPAVFVTLDAFPLTPHGKIDRSVLPAPDRTRSRIEGPFVAPRDAVEIQLAWIWADIFDMRPIGVTDNFFELGGNSFLAVNLIAQIQKHFGQKLPLSVLFEGATIEQIAAILRQQALASSQSPLVAIQPGGSKRPFFCIHPSGGGVLCYHDLSRHLGCDQPFYGLELLLPEGEEAHQVRIEEMAASYIEALRRVQPEDPYFLGGWSFGGLVAFEMAQQLLRQRQKVALLALLDTNLPQSVSVDENLLMVQFAEDQARRKGKTLTLSLDHIRRLEPGKRPEYVMEQMKLANLALPSAEYPWLLRFLQLNRMTMWATKNYMPQLYPGKITLFQACETKNESLGQLTGSIDTDGQDAACDWSRFSSQPVSLYVVPGNHATMIFEPHVCVLAEQLRRCLKEAEAFHG